MSAPQLLSSAGQKGAKAKAACTQHGHSLADMQSTEVAALTSYLRSFSAVRSAWRCFLASRNACNSCTTARALIATVAGKHRADRCKGKSSSHPASGNPWTGTYRGPLKQAYTFW